MKKLLLLIIVIVASCSKTENIEQNKQTLSLKLDNIELKVRGYYQIEVEGEQPITFTPENDFYLSVDETGKINAKKIGETKIKVSDKNGSKDINVKINPIITDVADYGKYVGKSLNDIKKDFNTTFRKNAKIINNEVKYDDYYIYTRTKTYNVIDSTIFIFDDGGSVCKSIQ